METDATPAFDLTDATNYPTSSLSGTITNAQLAGSIANAKLANSSVSLEVYLLILEELMRLLLLILLMLRTIQPLRYQER